MQERTGIVKYKGNPVTLLGPDLKVGDPAPDFRVVDSGLAPVTLANFAGKTKIINTVPSFDTPVCDAETRRFNQEAANLPGDIVVLSISLDPPFAQQKWCATAVIDQIRVLSDDQERSFGLAYGVLVKELVLLSRSLFVIDEQNIIRYLQHVPEITQEADFATALAAARGEIVTRQLPGDGFCGAY